MESANGTFPKFSVLLYIYVLFKSIGTVPQCSVSPDLRYGGMTLDCSNCHLSQGDLKELISENVTSLFISYNDLGILVNDVLSHFKLLRRLECTQCRLVRLEKEALRGLNNLEILRLDKNNLKLIEHAFPTGVFRNVPHLKTLDIQDNDNHRKGPKYSHYIDIFDTLQELRDLSIDSFVNLRIGEEFTRLANLDRLEINCAWLQFISNESLYGFQHSNISHFQLSGKGASIPKAQIGFGMFHNLPNVSYLGIDYLRIGNHNMMRLMKPLAGRSIKTIVFNLRSHLPTAPLNRELRMEL